MFGTFYVRAATIYYFTLNVENVRSNFILEAENPEWAVNQNINSWINLFIFKAFFFFLHKCLQAV